jgi:DNA-binding MarR family transcriptional regulator
VTFVTSVQSVETDLGWALGAIMRSYLRSAGDAVAGVPGGPRGYQVLATAARGESTSQLALAQHLGVVRTVMTYLLDDLEGAGFVERRPDPADRRARRVAITEAGRERLCALRVRLLEAEAGLLEPLTDEECAVLRGLLHRLATSVAPANPCQIAAEFAAQAAAEGHARRRRR